MSKLIKTNKKDDKIIVLLFEWIEVIILSTVSVFFITTFLFKHVTVSGDSMLPTLKNEDRVILAKYVVTSPRVGDIVVVTNSGIPGHDNLIKRIIAVGGQKVKVDPKKGEVYVDGILEKATYTKEPTKTIEDMIPDQEITVPLGCFFVMGDNRNHSTDSRSKIIGCVERKKVLGKALVVIFPFDRWSLL
ncbi:MAG: signal peptidase I [Oscillospiraceae bacterium]|nr:signal peptidase I [Oscillospiraceae bacterium]